MSGSIPELKLERKIQPYLLTGIFDHRVPANSQSYLEVIRRAVGIARNSVVRVPYQGYCGMSTMLRSSMDRASSK